MKNYIYDGTFEGLLTCIYHHYYSDKVAGIYTGENYQPSFLYESMKVVTDMKKAEKVYGAIQSKISDYDLRCLYRAFLSTVPEKEMKIVRYTLMGFRLGSKISNLHGNEAVNDFQSILKKVSVETERMLQFVRFSVMEGGLLYAEIQPDHDVLELLHTHFCERFRNDPFIIRGAGRNKAMIAYRKHWYISEFGDERIPRKSQAENEYRRLWNTYFDHIAIRERTNPGCQKNSMPLRYRKHLTEVQNDVKECL